MQLYELFEQDYKKKKKNKQWYSLGLVKLFFHSLCPRDCERLFVCGQVGGGAGLKRQSMCSECSTCTFVWLGIRMGDLQGT